MTPIDLLDLRVSAGQRASLQLPEGSTAGLFVMKGEILVNGTGQGAAGDLIVLDREGRDVVLDAGKDTTVFVMSGEPIDEPISGYGPFVMNTAEEIQQAISDMRNGRLARVAVAST